MKGGILNKGEYLMSKRRVWVPVGLATLALLLTGASVEVSAQGSCNYTCIPIGGGSYCAERPTGDGDYEWCDTFQGACYGNICDELTLEAIGLDGSLMTQLRFEQLASSSSDLEGLVFETYLGQAVLRRPCDGAITLTVFERALAPEIEVLLRPVKRTAATAAPEGTH